MCGRFFVDAKNREIDRLLQLLPPNCEPVKTGDIYPGDMALTLAWAENTMKAMPMLWGFPRAQGKGLIFNARQETALHKPMFRNALTKSPVAIPANGFYEWYLPPDEIRKKKCFFMLPDARVLYLAGFCKFFGADYGAAGRHFTILTTEPNESVRQYHDRMPVLLTDNDLQQWLRGKNLENILNNTPVELLVEEP